MKLISSIFAHNMLVVDEITVGSEELCCFCGAWLHFVTEYAFSGEERWPAWA